MYDIKELQKLFEDYTRKQELEGEPKNLYDSFHYMLNLPAKRLRPVLLMMACELFGTSAKRALPQAFAIELFHNFSLIHDDIMDAAPLRRGKPTVYKKFGETTAILSGDAMLVYAYQYLIQVNKKTVQKLLEVFNSCAVKVCEGQQLDMNYEATENISLEDYLKMIELKTATLIATSLQIGAIIGGASHRDLKHMFNFGRNLGISFQLKDDWLDAFGREDKVGKRRGGDIVQNKKTFLMLEALAQADPETSSRLKELYASKKLEVEGKVSQVLGIFQQLGISELSEKTVNKYYSKALSDLDKINVPSKRKEPLKEIAARLLQREN